MFSSRKITKPPKLLCVIKRKTNPRKNNCLTRIKEGSVPDQQVECLWSAISSCFYKNRNPQLEVKWKWSSTIVCKKKKKVVKSACGRNKGWAAWTHLKCTCLRQTQNAYCWACGKERVVFCRLLYRTRQDLEEGREGWVPNAEDFQISET